MRCELVRKLIHTATDAIVRAPVVGEVVLHTVPRPILTKISGNAVIRCGFVGTPHLGSSTKGVFAGVGNNLRLCTDIQPKDPDSIEEFGLVGQVDQGPLTCCSSGCVYHIAHRRRSRP